MADNATIKKGLIPKIQLENAVYVSWMKLVMLSYLNIFIFRSEGEKKPTSKWRARYSRDITLNYHFPPNIWHSQKPTP